MDASEIVKLIGRLRDLPAYDGHHLNFKLREQGTPEGTGTRDTKIFMVHDAYRQIIITGLEALLTKPDVPALQTWYNSLPCESLGQSHWLELLQVLGVPVDQG